MLKPLVDPIPFSGFNTKLEDKTIKEFKITEYDNALMLGLNINKHDHIS